LTTSVAVTGVAGEAGVDEAVNVAGPAVVAQILTVATPPVVIAVCELKVPRVETKLTTVLSAIGTPAFLKVTVTGTFGVQGDAAIGMSAPAAGAVKENCCELTCNVRAALVPRAWAVIVSVAALTAVTVNVT